MTKYARKKDNHWIDVYRVPEDFADLATLNRCLPGGGFEQVDDSLKHGAKDNGDGNFTNPDGGNRSSPLAWDAFDFTGRFTPEERIAIRSAAKSNTSVEDFLHLLELAGMTGTRIKSDDATLNAAMDTLEQAGLIAQGRKAEILGG